MNMNLYVFLTIGSFCVHGSHMGSNISNMKFEVLYDRS